MFTGIKLWLYSIGAGIIAILVGIFKYRGYKIDQQEKELEERNQELQAMTRYNAQKDKIQEFEHRNDVESVRTDINVKEEIQDGTYSI